jgi:hypothetical protein
MGRQNMFLRISFAATAFRSAGDVREHLLLAIEMPVRGCRQRVRGRRDRGTRRAVDERVALRVRQDGLHDGPDDVDGGACQRAAGLAGVPVVLAAASRMFSSMASSDLKSSGAFAVRVCDARGKRCQPSSNGSTRLAMAVRHTEAPDDVPETVSRPRVDRSTCSSRTMISTSTSPMHADDVRLPVRRPVCRWCRPPRWDPLQSDP